MATLKEGDFELDGYLLPGTKSSGTYIQEFTMGGVDVRTQDIQNPNGNNVMFGRDQFTPEPWTFKLRIRKADLSATMTAFGSFTKNLLGSTKRLTPGAVSVLRFKMGGKNYRIYGRARGLVILTENMWTAAIIDSEFRFDPQEFLLLDDEQQQLILPIFAGSARGFVTPIVTPLTTILGGERLGVETNTGTAPAPFTVAFKGPITNPCLKVSGKEIKLLTTLASDQTVTVDTRAMTATRNGGANMAGTLSPASRLSTARVSPGSVEFAFSGIDASGTARATVSWYPAYHTF